MLLELDHVTKEYIRGGKRFFSLDDVCFGIDKGDFFTIIGRSGSGKTTLLTVAAGLAAPDSGDVVFKGKKYSELSDRELSAIRGNGIGFIPQGLGTVPDLTVIDNVRLPSFIYPEKADDTRALAILEKTGIADLAQSYPNELSGGELKRVLIARALFSQPEILIADEPTADLDRLTTEEIMKLFSELRRDGTAVLLVTHEMDTIAYGDRVFTCESGRLTEGKQ